MHLNSRDTSSGFWQPSAVTPEIVSAGLRVQRGWWAPTLIGTGHVGLGDVTPDGEYAVLTVERPHSQMGKWMAEPGRGVFCDLWLTDGTTRWQLTSKSQSGLAVIWPTFSPDGAQLVWGVCYSAPTTKEIFGFWRLCVADLKWTEELFPQPYLANIRTITPEAGRFFEPYGWCGDRLLVASDMGRPGWWDTQIMTVGLDGSSQLVSPGDAPCAWYVTTDYCEFARVLSDGSIIFCRGWGASAGGMDHWVKPVDGKIYRLTQRTTSPHLAVGFVVSPDERSLLAGYSYDARSSRIDAVMYDLVRD